MAGGHAEDLPVPEQGASAHARVSDHAGPAARSHDARRRIAFQAQNPVGVRDHDSFAAQWLAYALPCQRFAGGLTTAAA
jgi:hypothetical protein